jgi:hypothetical protein
MNSIGMSTLRYKIGIKISIFTNQTCWDGGKCSEDTDIILCSSRDGFQLKQGKETC